MPPKRFMRRRGARSGFKRRRYGRPRNAAFRLKMGGLRLRRFKRVGRRKLGRRGVKPYPGWFKTLTKTIGPTDLAGNYGNQITVGKNATGMCTHWKHLSLVDIQLVLDTLGATAGMTSSGATANLPSAFAGTTPTALKYNAGVINTMKAYVSDVTRKHIWRNSANYGETNIQFYVLKPRRDIPSYRNGAALSTITPPCTTNYGTGGTQSNVTSWYQATLDEQNAMAPTGGNAITAGFLANQLISTDWSPFWSQQLTSNFKIKPLKVVGPNGKSSKIRLQPGQECYYEGKYRGPTMYNFNKLWLNTSDTSCKVTDVWEVRRETPIILCVHNGSVCHDSTTLTSVGTTPIYLDYFQQYKLKVWQPTIIPKRQAYVSTSIPNFTGNPEQVTIVTGVGGIAVGET